MRTLVLVLTLMPAVAQAADTPPPRIVVSANGHASTMPDRAEISYTVHGEGTTSDEAVRALVAKRVAIDGGLATFKAQPQASNVSVGEVRGRDCNTRGFGNPHLSTGECAIVGYTADLFVRVRTGAVKDAGTIVGLIGRLGGTNPHIQTFQVSDDAAARRAAMTEAFAAARAQAQAVAAAAGVHLGPIIQATDGSFGGLFGSDDIVLSGSRVDAPSIMSVPAPPPPPPPVPMALTPQPIETTARVTVIYQIVP
ncbi:SIMPL domain-containing protein [Sphingomonas nostoxanthinifaciens]|uniref:SIMPL domain-containing protein n=1 Tax=Sphingomonas nostoxanthinifaciens TaxID=2872652 RepID=UPI001CC1DFE7|nr:SIMPL domain-containing protein [Sphingomonas nostoxanthinifaciens]UAK26234.1 SIMPL domain-containing protein [Sphingomonas nostoxanthinifaciens]